MQPEILMGVRLPDSAHSRLTGSPRSLTPANSPRPSYGSSPVRAAACHRGALPPPPRRRPGRASRQLDHAAELEKARAITNRLYKDKWLEKLGYLRPPARTGA